jgi:hypothetical protein
MTSEVANVDYFLNWRDINEGLKVTDYAHLCRHKTSSFFVNAGWSHFGTGVFHAANTYVPKNV